MIHVLKMTELSESIIEFLAEQHNIIMSLIIKAALNLVFSMMLW